MKKISSIQKKTFNTEIDNGQFFKIVGGDVGQFSKTVEVDVGQFSKTVGVDGGRPKKNWHRALCSMPADDLYAYLNIWSVLFLLYFRMLLLLMSCVKFF